jgi:ABC-type Zn uptake system ZnuABC Zn-binding protein ZnuA
VLASESFLADIAQNVAGDRLQADSLVPVGMDPHAFDPTPRDVERIAQSDVLIVNGAGLEAWLEPVLENAGSHLTVIEASAGLVSRAPDETEESGETHGVGDEEHEHGAEDPHFWLDPNNVITYAENIRDGLIAMDADGAGAYRKNTDDYIAELQSLDGWIREQVATVPPERRILVTNHESFGYFADRYGFTIVGTVIPSVSTGSSPSAQQMAHLVEAIKASGAPAIFLETGSNPDLARQVAEAAEVRVVTELYTHSLATQDGMPLTYLEMMRHDVQEIVEALR